MKHWGRFMRAKEIAAERIDLPYTHYSWRPRTVAGWAIRIACTDLGQDAWYRAGQLATEGQDSSRAAAMPASETGSSPEQDP